MQKLIISKQVLIISSEFPPGPGGIGNHAFNLAKYLKKNGFLVRVIGPKRNHNLKNSNDKYSTLEWLNNKSFLLQTYYYFIITIYLKIKNNPDTYIICSGRLPLIFGGIMKIIFKNKNFILIAHGLDINPSQTLKRLIVNYFIKRYDRVIAVSRYTSNHLKGKINKKAIVINNGIDPYIILKHKKKKSKTKKIQNNKLSLITVGKISNRKGQLNVLKSLPRIIKKYPTVHYHMVGIPDELNKLALSEDYYQIKRYYTIHGILSDRKMFELMDQSDIFLMLSNHTNDGDFEGFGIAIIEANILGLPAIGSEGCGISDAIIHGETGYLINPENTSELIISIDKIINNYNQFSKNSIQRAYQLSWDMVIKKYIRALNINNR